MTKKKAPGETSPGGRPPIFAEPDQLDLKAQQYLEHGALDEKFVPTINGLAIALGMTRETLNQYRHKPLFSDTLKSVIGKIEIAWEKRLWENGCTGAIFWLKNQGWADKIETVNTTTVTTQNIGEIEAELREASQFPGIKQFLETLK